MISEVDEASVTVNFEGQTFKVARYCVRRKAAPKEVGAVEWKPASNGSEETVGLAPVGVG